MDLHHIIHYTMENIPCFSEAYNPKFLQVQPAKEEFMSKDNKT